MIIDGREFFVTLLMGSANTNDAIQFDFSDFNQHIVLDEMREHMESPSRFLQCMQRECRCHLKGGTCNAP